jgi:hypothetical protein
MPFILNNNKSKPLIGKQYLVLSNFVAEFDPDEMCNKNIIKALHYIFCQEYKLGCLHQQR